MVNQNHFSKENRLTSNSGVSKIRHVLGGSPITGAVYTQFITMVTYPVVHGIHMGVSMAMGVPQCGWFIGKNTI